MFTLSRTPNNHENLSLYQNIIHNRTYARQHNKRLEYYPETVDRYVDYIKTKITDEFLLSEIEICRGMIKRQEIMPSMRLFFSAGAAVEAENAMGFNCKYQAITSLRSFSDLLYSLLCTCGVGISVQKEYITGLPRIPEHIYKSDDVILVDDNRSGWGNALKHYLNVVFRTGESLGFDTSLVRGKGSPLVTSGGYASGPEPLIELRTFIESMLVKRQGMYLRPLDCFDIACMIAQCAVQGGVRRAAIITLFDDDDDEMLYAKTKENLLNNPHRYNSNNTMVWGGEHTRIDRAFEQTRINGEPGFLFKDNLIVKMNSLGRHSPNGWGVNPCVEIILRPNQFCNLTEVVLRQEHTLHMDMLKVRYATILGLIQSGLTDYGFIDPETKFNQENDPIIGVSLTGLCDCPEYSKEETYPERLAVLKDVANKTTDELWERAGLKFRPKAITCVKPSGTVSQLVNSSSGTHPRYAKYYIRRVLIGSDSHLYDKLAKSGVPYLEFACIDGRVFEFPMKAPENSVVISDVNAIDQLAYINVVNNIWCDHNASCTIYVKKDEWESVKNILKNNHSFISLSFLPYEVSTDTSGFLYLPYEETTEADYNERKMKENNIKWEDIVNDSTAEKTNHVIEFACAGGSCAI